MNREENLDDQRYDELCQTVMKKGINRKGTVFFQQNYGVLHLQNRKDERLHKLSFPCIYVPQFFF